ncbi:MAG TPA: multicopper oxidase family protein [Conexibacter sp.]|jgi:FtsP/CotA-like multicopper oxidase with cupredoxin domain
MSTPTPRIPRDTAGLPAARPTNEVQLADGERYTLHIGPVTKRIGEATVRMLAYNGSVPGPAMRVPQDAEVVVDIENEGDLEATVHWHGLRLENRYDGTHETQELIAVGGRYTARVTFPDPGVYWYHPHVREDYGQEMGLYGNCIVVPADPDYWPCVHRELALTLDDVLIEDGQIAPFSPDETTYAAMGRFGNVLLVAGEPELKLSARAGEVVRLYLTNTANTRVFKVALPDARMKLVGGDSGRVEHERLVDDVILAPSERVVVDVLFASPGQLTLEHRTPDHTYNLADITVSEDQATPPLAEAFVMLRTAPELTAARERLTPLIDAPPDKTLAFVAEMDMGKPEVGAGESHAHAAHGHSHAMADGIEWEDDMVEVNKLTTPANMRWSLVDRTTGATNRDIQWKFRVGDLVKIRLVNEMDSDHPMHHPFHIHGAGRFLVLARDGVVEPNLVWKDTVLVRTGETMDIALDVTNAGRWMAHCHIAEHHESGMMFSFEVTE